VELAEGVKMMTTKYEAYLVDKTFELTSQLAAKDVEIVQLRRELAEARAEIILTLEWALQWTASPREQQQDAIRSAIEAAKKS
jgi:hypothetical protein